ncbi:MAG TPA: exopolysaccharide Pel transporter PelG [Candidatus Binatia bacterium]|nr:exopolysaccharide Pel transporter PelG [Candidatus Binatia bacterium]
MAGIGWRLERLIHQGIVGATAAYATGAAVMALPWMLTTAVLVSLPAVIGRARADLATAGTVVNVAYAAALLVAGPVQIVISRYVADRVYEGRPRAIAAPFCRGLGATFLLCSLPTAVVLLALGLPPRTALWGAVLSSAVGAQWTALSVGNGLCSPALVLGAVGAGSAQSFLLATLLVAIAGLGVPGYLFGLISGQALTLVVLLVGIFRALPEDSDEGATLLPALRDYAALAGAGLAFNASLWVDKLIAWLLVDGEAASLHAGASTIAWFSTIPCLAWIFVEVETTFYRRFRSFYAALEDGATLPELRRRARGLVSEAVRLLRGAISVQAGVTVFLQLAADPLARWLGLPPGAIMPYRLLLIGAGAQAIGLLGLILLYYFDLRREACLAASSLFVTVTALTTAASVSGLPPSVGTALGCSIGSILTWHFVLRGIGTVLENTLLGQPFGVVAAGRDPS